MNEKRRRGVRIGSYASGMIGNLAHLEIDHILTEKYGAKIQRNCDDLVIFGRSKAEVRFLLNVYNRLCEERGMVVKAGSFYGTIKGHGKKKRRKRQRGPVHRLSGVPVQSGQPAAAQVDKDKIRKEHGPRKKPKKKKATY